MDEDEYGLGVDIGVADVHAVAWSRATDEPEVVPVSVGAGRSARVMARVGSTVPLYEGGLGQPAAQVAAELVVVARDAAEAQLGRRPRWVVVAVPPSWGSYRSELLAAALVAAVGPEVSLVSGALAATYAHLRSGRLSAAATVAVHDLGAGTLDTAVVRAVSGGEVEHVGTPPAPVPWGGADIDDALLAHVLTALPPGTPLDRESAHALRDEVVAAKVALSSDTTAQLVPPPRFGGPAGGLRLLREELDELIGPGVERSVEELSATVAGAGLRPSDLDAVVLVGGAVRVPLVGECLSAALGRPLVVDPDPERTAARGAARLAMALGAPEEEYDGESATVPPVHLVRPGSSGSTARSALVARPPTVPRRAPARRPVRRPAGRTSGRVFLVAAMLIGLVVVVPTLSAALLSGNGPDPGPPVVAVPEAAAGTAPPGPAPEAAGAGGAGARADTDGGGDRDPAAGRRDTRSPGSTVARMAGSAQAAAQRVATGAAPATLSSGASSAPSGRLAAAAAPPATSAGSTPAAVAPRTTPGAPAPGTPATAPATAGPAPATQVPPTTQAPPTTEAPPTTQAPPPAPEPEPVTPAPPPAPEPEPVTPAPPPAPEPEPATPEPIAEPPAAETPVAP